MLDAHEVARHAPAWGRHDNAAGVRELVRRLVPEVMEAGGLGQRVDRRLIPRQEVPAALGLGTLVALEVRLLLPGGKYRSLFRIEAHGDDVEFLADGLVEHAQR